MWFLNSQPISGAPNAPSYSVTAAGNYSVDIVGNCSGQMTNTIAVTDVMAPGTISPATQTANSNVPGVTLTGTLPAVWSGTFTYQWQSCTDGVSWQDINSSGAGQNYTPLAQTTTCYYRRKVINGSNTGYSNTAAVIVGYSDLLNTNPGHNSNYILTSVPGVGLITSNAGFLNQTTANIKQSIQYFDGLGRLIQTIQIKGSPGFNDFVQPTAYDALGRESTKYLPYSSTVNDGSYKSDALLSNAGQAAFYASPPATSGISSVSNPYAVIGFEPSPLSRPVERGSSGAAWQISGTANSNNADNAVKIDYYTNDQTSTFSSTYSVGTANPGSKIVALYTATINSDNSHTLARSNNNATYRPGSLYVTIKKDENWQVSDGCIGTTEQYLDFNGHLVLKRAYNLKIVGAIKTVEMLSTYYVYDNFNNLAFVLTPASNPDANAVILQTTLDNLCYQYQYDSRKRMSGKRIPGKGWEYTVYNVLDEPVATQDGNQRALKEWVIAKYDAQGRQIMTALWNNGGTNGTAISPSSLQSTLSGITTNLWETTTTAGNGYTNVAWPISAITQTLTVNYYDGYSIPGIPTKFIPPTGATSTATGLLTATQTNVLGTPDMLWMVRYYDNLERVITTYKQHYFGGMVSVYNYDQLNTTFNFNNQVTTTTRYHYNTSNPGSVVLTVSNRNIYDQVGRKINTWEQLQKGTNTADSRTLIVQNVYNEIGQVMTKNLHNNTDSVHFFQSVNYTYNERGWTLNTTAALFTEQLQYNINLLNLSGFVAQYNGNIASMTRTATINLPTTLSYTYGYDRLNRLVNGISTDGNSEQNLVYDQNGNITALQRTGSETDNLTYTYTNSGMSNQINTITNTGGSTPGLPVGTTTYNSYDANGNTLYDGRNTTGIQYNLLNLPQYITAKNITYIYDASGKKLRRLNGSTLSGVTEYMDGIEYDGGSFTFIQTEEGEALANGNAYNYEYDLADHLGNVRVAFDTGTGVTRQVQQNDYYPFGLNILRGPAPNPPNKYLYNKKELQDVINEYDYGARFYDPVIARWGTADPLAETSRSWSPYNYGENNPVRNIDLDGMSTASWMQANGLTADDLTNIYTAPSDVTQTAPWETPGSTGTNGKIGNTDDTNPQQIGQKGKNDNDSKTRWDKNFRKFLVTVIMESKNGADAPGIAAAMLNRMAVTNTSFDDDDWLYKISIHHPGKTKDQDIKSAFNAYSTDPKSDYQILLNKSDDAFNAPDSKWAVRLNGALTSYDSYQEDFDASEGSFFWNKTSQITAKKGPYENIHKGIYHVIYDTGPDGTTFFRYTDPNKTWP